MVHPLGPQAHRSGAYVQQPAGHRAFIPAPLPPDPPVALDHGLQEVLSRADREIGRLDGSVTTLPNPDLFVMMYVRKEAVLSSQVEGIQSSLQDVLAAEARILSPDRPRDAHEVMNYVGAMNLGLDRLSQLPVSVRLIRDIHRRLLDGVRGSRLSPGELREAQNWIGPPGCTVRDATFVPPPPRAVPDAMGDLEDFLHRRDDVPTLIKAGLIHAQFETIHPFLDGNGRVGRMLITFFLTERKVLRKPVLCLSHYLRRHRQQYYDRLQAVRDHGDWESWLTFFLEGVVEVSREAVETTRRILVMREDHRRIITENLGRAAGNGHRVIEALYEHPICSVNEVERLAGTSYAAANHLVARLVDCGILVEVTGRVRNRRFAYQSYIDLFSET